MSGCARSITVPLCLLGIGVEELSLLISSNRGNLGLCSLVEDHFFVVLFAIKLLLRSLSGVLGARYSFDLVLSSVLTVHWYLVSCVN